MFRNELYEVNKKIKCTKCGHVGAIKYYGNYYPSGLGDRLDTMGELTKSILSKHRDSPYMSHAIGFGGTIPWECTNCGNVGLNDIDGLEGYRKTFESL